MPEKLYTDSRGCDKSPATVPIASHNDITSGNSYAESGKWGYFLSSLKIVIGKSDE